MAATSIAYIVEAWPVTTDEWRQGFDGSATHSDRRDIVVGHIVRVTRNSRWQGEGESHAYEFVAGKLPRLIKYLDSRWGDSGNDRGGNNPVEWSAVKKFIKVESNHAQ